MKRVLEIKKLNYDVFHNLSLSFDINKFYFIIGGNSSYKDTLFDIIAGFIQTENVIYCDNIPLNLKNKYLYTKNIGVIERVNEFSFNYSFVDDELLNPLMNLGYQKSTSLKIIDEMLDLFEIKYLYARKISQLNRYEKQKLLIVLALLHHPKVLLINNALEIFNKSERENILSKLKVLTKKNILTILNFTNSLDDVVYSDKILLLNKGKVLKKMKYQDIFDNDKLFYENNIEIPFIFDIVIKLKMYNLINKNYDNLKELVDDVWK